MSEQYSAVENRRDKKLIRSVFSFALHVEPANLAIIIWRHILPSRIFPGYTAWKRFPVVPCSVLKIRYVSSNSIFFILLTSDIRTSPQPSAEISSPKLFIHFFNRYLGIYIMISKARMLLHL